MALTAKLLNSYKKRETGNTVFRYLVSGTDKDIQQYTECAGENIVVDDTTGKPIFFTTRYIADSIKLIVTSNNNVVADDTEISKLQSLVEQYGPDVARLIMMNSKPSASAE
jgi:hypothetical protein